VTSSGTGSASQAEVTQGSASSSSTTNDTIKNSGSSSSTSTGTGATTTNQGNTSSTTSGSTTISTNTQADIVIPNLFRGYKLADSPLASLSQSGFSQREMAWFGAEILRSMIRAEQQGRNSLNSNDLAWMAWLLKEKRAIQ
jgi:hypothetical protein